MNLTQEAKKIADSALDRNDVNPREKKWLQNDIVKLARRYAEIKNKPQPQQLNKSPQMASESNMVRIYFNYSRVLQLIMNNKLQKV